MREFIRCVFAAKYVKEGGGAEADKARSLLKMMGLIGTLLGGKTVTQVALNYLICKGMLPPCANLLHHLIARNNLPARGAHCIIHYGVLHP
jgi:hypothetical protein